MTPPVPPDELYLLSDGVHRSVAAREAGLAGVLAWVCYDDGVQPPRQVVVPLDQLYSPHITINRFDRRRDLLDLIRQMGSILGRSRVEAVIVAPVTPAVAARYTPVRQVVVTNHGGPS